MIQKCLERPPDDRPAANHLILFRFFSPRAKARTTGHYHRRNCHNAALARFPLKWNHLSEKKSRQINKLEHILAGEVFNFAGKDMLQQAQRSLARKALDAVQHARILPLNCTWIFCD